MGRDSASHGKEAAASMPDAAQAVKGRTIMLLSGSADAAYAPASILWPVGFESRLFGVVRLGLMFCLPFGIGHAVNDLA